MYFNRFSQCLRWIRFEKKNPRLFSSPSLEWDQHYRRIQFLPFPVLSSLVSDMTVEFLPTNLKISSQFVLVGIENIFRFGTLICVIDLKQSDVPRPAKTVFTRPLIPYSSIWKICLVQQVENLFVMMKSFANKSRKFIGCYVSGPYLLKMFLQEVALTTFPLKYFLFCLERNETRSFSFLQGENRETDDLVFVAKR